MQEEGKRGLSGEERGEEVEEAVREGRTVLVGQGEEGLVRCKVLVKIRRAMGGREGRAEELKELGGEEGGVEEVGRAKGAEGGTREEFRRRS